MRRWIMAVVLSASSAAIAATTPIGRVSKGPNGVTMEARPGTLRLQVWDERIIRVTYAVANGSSAERSLAVIAKPNPTQWQLEEAADEVIVKTAALQARVDRRTGAVTFADAAGVPFLRECAGGRTLATSTISGEQVVGPAQEYELGDGEAIFGLGQHQAGVMNYVGKAVHLQQENREVGIPVLMSSKGYGLLWDNPAVTDVDVGKAVPGVVRWSSEAGEAIDYYVLYGPQLDRAIAGYRTLTGSVPMFARWAWGFWQSRERYKTQDELLGVAREYRKRGIPIDGMVQDWQYWIPQPWGSHAFGENFPDPKGMLKELHDANLRLIISVWAKFDQGSKNYDELNKAGFLYPPVYQNVFPKGQAKWYDAFNPDARKMYWRQMSEELFSVGIDGWWLDATEPELGGKWGELRDLKTGAGPGYKVFNAFPLMTTSAVHDGQRAERSDKRVFILTRSAYAGQQRNAAVTWSGDIHGDWSTFVRQIPAGLNFSLSGIPYWNTDIGGFFAPKKIDSKYRELFVRWFQFGAFCPMFRVHGTDVSKEMWEFGPEVEPILVKYDKLRYRLLPYIYSVAWRVTHDGDSMMRPLVMDFADDRRVYGIGDQYLFGPALMVNPITQAGATSRPVYLPGHSDWTDFETGKRFKAGQEIDMPAPLDTLPLLVRAGAIIPLGPIVQNATESCDPIELRIYRGADGAFTLYEDEGDNYNYETGSHATIPISWNDARRTLSIGTRQGTFPGIHDQHTFRVVWVRDGIGMGLEPVQRADAEVQYTGKAVDVVAPD